MTIDGVVKGAGFRRMNEETRWNVDNWNALRGLPWDVTETGEAFEAVQARRPHMIHLLLRADLRKYGVMVGTAVLGKTSKPHGRVSK